MASVPRPPIGPEDLTPPPSAEAMQGVLGPLAPVPTPTPFNLPVAPIRNPAQPHGPIGPLPQISNPIDVAPPPSAQTPTVNTPLSVTPQFAPPNLPGYGPAPGLPAPPVPPGLQQQSVPPESINPELTTGTGVSAEQLATSGVPAQQQKAYEGFMKRWAIPEFKKPSAMSEQEFNTGIAPPPSAENIKAAQTMEGAGGVDNDQISNLAKMVSKQKGAEQQLYTAIADAALGLASPESIATMVSAELGGTAIQGLVNSPKVVNIISKLPGTANIRQAVDFAARNAIPGAFVGMAGKQGVEAAQQGKPVDAAVNALIAVAGALGIHADLKVVGEIHPTAPEAPGGNVYADMPGGKRAAEATAEKLEAQGQGLAGASWRDVAQRVQTENTPVTFKAGDRALTLKPLGKLKGREFFTLVDDTGKELTGGTLPTVQAWMGMNLPEIEIPGGESGSRLTVSPEGKLSSAPTPYKPALGNPAAPISGIFRDADALYQKGVDVAKNNPSFGTRKLRADTGASAEEAEAILQRLQDDGIVKRTQNARGSVVYHQIPLLFPLLFPLRRSRLSHPSQVLPPCRTAISTPSWAARPPRR